MISDEPIEAVVRSSANTTEWKFSPNISLAGVRSMSVTITFASGQRMKAPMSVPSGLGTSSVYFARPVVWSMAVVLG